MTSFPTSVKSFAQQTDGASSIDAADVNEAYDEIEAIENFLLPGAGDEIVFNEAGINQDTRIEGDNDPNVAFVDASTDRLGVGTIIPRSKLHVHGQQSMTQSLTDYTGVLKGTIVKTGLADNTATNVFTITTTNEGGSTDGGVYSVFVHAVVSHGTANNSAETSCMSFCAQFARAINAAGTGANCAVVENAETAVAASTAATKTITAITMTVVETSEYVVTVLFQVDCGGTTVTTADVFASVEIVYAGFLTPPVLASA